MPDAGETAGSPRPVRVGVLGAGISGICAAVFLREKLGLKDESIIGIERHPSVGGNWYENCGYHDEIRFRFLESYKH